MPETRCVQRVGRSGPSRCSSGSAPGQRGRFHGHSSCTRAFAKQAGSGGCGVPGTNRVTGLGGSGRFSSVPDSWWAFFQFAAVQLGTTTGTGCCWFSSLLVAGPVPQPAGVSTDTTHGLVSNSLTGV